MHSGQYVEKNSERSSAISPPRPFRCTGALLLLDYVSPFSSSHEPLKGYSHAKCEQLYDVLNRKHFIEGGVLNDIKCLLDAAAEVGWWWDQIPVCARH